MLIVTSTVRVHYMLTINMYELMVEVAENTPEKQYCQKNKYNGVICTVMQNTKRKLVITDQSYILCFIDIIEYANLQQKYLSRSTVLNRYSSSWLLYRPYE